MGQPHPQGLSRARRGPVHAARVGSLGLAAAQARGLREQSSRPARKSGRWLPSTAVGAPLWRPFAPLLSSLPPQTVAAGNQTSDLCFLGTGQHLEITAVARLFAGSAERLRFGRVFPEEDTCSMRTARFLCAALWFFSSCSRLFAQRYLDFSVYKSMKDLAPELPGARLHSGLAPAGYELWEKGQLRMPAEGFFLTADLGDRGRDDRAILLDVPAGDETATYVLIAGEEAGSWSGRPKPLGLEQER